MCAGFVGSEELSAHMYVNICYVCGLYFFVYVMCVETNLYNICGRYADCGTACMRYLLAVWEGEREASCDATGQAQCA